MAHDAGAVRPAGLRQRELSEKSSTSCSRPQSQGRIQYLMLSQHNLGKGGAWNMIFQAAPGEWLAYTDCDALFFDPGWL